MTASNGPSEGDDKMVKSVDGVAHSMKYDKIKTAIANADIVSLRALALDRRGLLKDELRMKAWPILLGIDRETPAPKPTEAELISHKYYDQVNERKQNYKNISIFLAFHGIN